MELVEILAYMHALRVVIVCHNEFEYGTISQLQFGRISRSHGLSAVVHHHAIRKFKEKMPSYDIRNLNTERLVCATFDDIEESFRTNSPKIRIANGCCTKLDCPTKIFYGCVVEAVTETIKSIPS